MEVLFNVYFIHPALCVSAYGDNVAGTLTAEILPLGPQCLHGNSFTLILVAGLDKWPTKRDWLRYNRGLHAKRC